MWIKTRKKLQQCDENDETEMRKEIVIMENLCLRVVRKVTNLREKKIASYFVSNAWGFLKKARDKKINYYFDGRWA